MPHSLADYMDDIRVLVLGGIKCLYVVNSNTVRALKQLYSKGRFIFNPMKSLVFVIVYCLGF